MRPLLPLTALYCLSLPLALSQTTLTLGPETLRTHVKPLGINLSGQTYYDSGQMLRNLIFRNPGFEGETWQSILHCKQVTATTCTDENPWTQWPANFLQGARFEILSGPAQGATGIVQSSSAAASPYGVTLTLPRLNLKSGDFLLVRNEKPGDAEAGWWPQLQGGASFATELHDLSPDTPGHQALRLEASRPLADARITSYFDSLAGHSFVQLHGPYRIAFRAKPLNSSRVLTVRLERLDQKHGLTSFFSRSLTLDPGWHNYTFDFPTSENGSAVGTVGLSFTVHEASALLDDVSLTPATHSPQNPTAFRDEVVETLRELHPGILRYMDNGTDFGSSLDNMLAPPFARRRAGSSTQSRLQEDIPIGLDEFLTLCQTLGAEPWYSMPAVTSPQESAALVEYLAGPASTPYGARRASLGHPRPWTEIFPQIHLELGNEEWNARSFAGSAIADPTVYAHRAAQLFTAARSSPYFQPQHFDLILGAWAANTWWSQQELAASQNTADTLAVAPYLFDDFNDASSVEAVFGPMLAQPEQEDSRPNGQMHAQLQSVQQLATVQKAPHPTHLAVYEVNLGSMTGSVSQQAIDLSIPSLGAGLAVADHMLLMLRDLGITDQAFFALPEFSNGFTSTTPGGAKDIPLWGAVVDMGGNTNRRRPQFLALQMVNHAILPNLIAVHTSGPNPTWNQPESPNDKIRLPDAHELQTFAFADGPHRSLILFNLSRTNSLPLAFAGQNAPQGTITQTVLTSANLTDSNEHSQLVTPHTTTLSHPPAQLPPHSLTVLTWTTH